MSNYPDGCTEDHIASLYEDINIDFDIDTDIEAVRDYINEIIEAVYVDGNIEKLEDNLEGLAAEFGISLSSMDLEKPILRKI